MLNKLEQLKKMTTVVADTGDIKAIERYSPQDATTNPSLILKAAAIPEYSHLISDAIGFAKMHSKDKAIQLKVALNKLAVNFGVEILKWVPGRVSTEVDARLSFDVDASIRQAHELIELYERQGVGRERILIKIASTWEGIQAAQKLEKEGIHCNLTLMFNFAQAVACADAGITLISPFVGRIYDWYKKNMNRDYAAFEDPGVLFVSRVYHYFRKFDYPTVVMGASFRHIGQIEELSGCDFLTISPNLLAELQQSEGELQQRLSLQDSKTMEMDRIRLSETDFRWMLNEDAMATEKLAEGIRLFAQDIVKLENQLLALL
ncbi:MAG: transaldolase [Gammaproteobacteria bacterium]|nr:transaldolase [Gammaproteobacteria bacterium]